MTKTDYLRRLYSALAPLPQSERNRVIHDYEEHFEEHLAAGQTEDMIIDDLGSPESAAEYFININKDDHGYNDNFSTEAAVIRKNVRTAHSWESAVWTILSIFIVPILIAFMIALFATAIALCAAGAICAVICFLVHGLSTGFILLGSAGVLITLFGIFASILALYDGVRLIGKYFKFITRRIKYGGKRV